MKRRVNAVIKVALVEDDAGVRANLVKMLDGAPGFHCLGAYPDGVAALQSIPGNLPDVVLMDLIMPGVDGVNATAIIHQTFPEIRIILMTSSVDYDPLEAMKRSGASAYLVKNGPAQEFESIIRKVVS